MEAFEATDRQIWRETLGYGHGKSNEGITEFWIGF